MRTVKNPVERRNEILDCAEGLFGSKGYLQTTINDVLEALGIAKGTFYYYFKSKEQLMEAVVMRFIEEGEAVAKVIAEDKTLSALEKMRILISGPGPDNKRKDMAIDQMHQSGNAEMHQMSLVETVRRFTPLLALIVEQGIEEGVFKTSQPYETVEFVLAGSEFLLDTGIFHWSAQDLIKRAKAMSVIMETLLGAEPGTFDYIYTRYEEMLSNQQNTETSIEMDAALASAV